MKSKSYVETHLDTLSNSITALSNDVDNDRYYVNKEYILTRLEYLKKLTTLVQDRVILEDENP